MAKSEAGKGDDLRKGVNYKKYWTNFDLISGQPVQTKAKKVVKKKGKTTYTY